jgi:hypothetical protein
VGRRRRWRRRQPRGRACRLAARQAWMSPEGRGARPTSAHPVAQLPAVVWRLRLHAGLLLARRALNLGLELGSRLGLRALCVPLCSASVGVGRALRAHNKDGWLEGWRADGGVHMPRPDRRAWAGSRRASPASLPPQTTCAAASRCWRSAPPGQLQVEGRKRGVLERALRCRRRPVMTGSKTGSRQPHDAGSRQPHEAGGQRLLARAPTQRRPTVWSTMASNLKQRSFMLNLGGKPAPTVSGGTEPAGRCSSMRGAGGGAGAPLRRSRTSPRSRAPWGWSR